MSQILVERISGKKAFTKKYPVIDGKIIIKRGGLGRGDLAFTPPFEMDRIVETGFWIFRRQKGYYIDGGDQLMPLEPDGDRPKWTAEPIIRAAKEKLLERQAKVSGSTTPLQYVMLFGLFILMGMVFLLMVNNGVIMVG